MLLTGSDKKEKTILPLWIRIAVPAAVSLILFMILIFGVHMPEFQQGMLDQKKSSLRNLTQIAIDIVDYYHQQEMLGKMSPEQARQTAARRISSLRFGPNRKDYYWVLDYEPTMIAHPYRPDLIGKNLSELEDYKGTPLIMNMVEESEETGEAFVSYYWQWKDQPGKVAPKISFVKRYEPWNWIIGTGLYIEELQNRIASRNRDHIYATVLIILVILLLTLYTINQGRRAGAKIQENAVLIQGVFNQSFQLMGVVSPEGVLKAANQTALELAGVEEEDVIGKFFWETPWWNHSSELVEKLRKYIVEAASGKIVREQTYNLTKDGRKVSLDFSFKPVFSDDGRVLFLIAEGRDISELIEAREQLALSEARFRGVFDQSLQFMGIISTSGVLVEVNRSALDYRGIRSEDVVGKYFWETPWWSTSKENQERLKDDIRRSSNGHIVRREVRTESDDGAVRYTDFSLKPAFDASGNILFLIAEGRAITDLKNAQKQLEKFNQELEVLVDKRTSELQEYVERLENTQKQLVQAEKMAALGDLVAGVAHEINTPIGVSVTSVSFMEEKLREVKSKMEVGKLRKSDFEKFLSVADEATKSTMINLDRASELIGNFKQVAVDQTSGQKRSFNLREYIDEILLSLRAKYKRTQHKINITCPDDLTLNTYPGALMQIFSNLIINSLVHGFDGIDNGTIEIRVDVGESKLRIHYSDDGNGMNQEQLGKIFEPFYTTRRNRGGTGLGMHIVYNIITARLGGTINVSSSPGQGTAFTINLPSSLICLEDSVSS